MEQNGFPAHNMWSFQNPASQPQASTSGSYQQQPQQQQQRETSPSLEKQRVMLELARETVKMRELELQIAAEKRKEREAELALAQLHITPPQQQQQQQTSQLPAAPQPLQMDFNMLNGYDAQPQLPAPQMDFNFIQPSYLPTLPSTLWSDAPMDTTTASSSLQSISVPGGGAPMDFSFDQFDTRAFDEVFKDFLDNPLYAPNPDVALNSNSTADIEFEPSPPEDQGDYASTGTGATFAAGLVPSPPEEPSGTSSALALTPSHTSSGDSASISTPSSITNVVLAAHPTPAQPPPPMIAGPTTRRSKKQVAEHLASCAACARPIAKLLLRGTRAELDVNFDIHYLCDICAPSAPASVPRKRVKQTDDTTLPTVCDVCLRNRGRGGIVPRFPTTNLQFAVEVVCIPCTQKYKRCSDCGGGSGRLGVGKWRCKELFDEGRKTCNLSHARLGTGELELGVWEVPREVQGEAAVEQVLDACEALWRENILRLAVPEILDTDSEAALSLHSFQDIQTKLLARGWPARDCVMKPDPSNSNRKYLALTWAKNRPRRGKTSTIGDRTGKVVKDDDWLFANIRKTNVFCPAGSMLVGLWLGNWDIPHQTVHITTTSPFDPGDLEDRSVVSIAQIINRIITEGTASPSLSLPPPAHVWVTYNDISPVIQSRLEESLIKKKSFFPVDEYVQRFPDVSRDSFVEPAYARTGWGGETEAPVKTLVKTLGRSLNWYRLQRMKMHELSQKKAVVAMSRKRKADADGNGEVEDANAPLPTSPEEVVEDADGKKVAVRYNMCGQ